MFCERCGKYIIIGNMKGEDRLCDKCFTGD